MRRLVGDDERLVEGHPRRVAATLLIVPRARVVHEDAAHHARGHGEEMRAVVPRDRLPVDQADVGLVDERRRLEAVPDALARHAASRDPVELVMDERNQALEGALVALPPFEQEPGDLCVVLNNLDILCLGLRSGRRFRVEETAPFDSRDVERSLRTGPAGALESAKKTANLQPPTPKEISSKRLSLGVGSWAFWELTRFLYKLFGSR